MACRPTAQPAPASPCELATTVLARLTAGQFTQPLATASAIVRVYPPLRCGSVGSMSALPREFGVLKQVDFSHGLANLVTNLINASAQSDDGEFEGIALGMHGFQMQRRLQRRQGTRSERRIVLEWRANLIEHRIERACKTEKQPVGSRR